MTSLAVMLCDEEGDEGDVMWVSTCFLLKKFKKYILQVIFSMFWMILIYWYQK
jgi:hypothetical protein